MILVHDVISFKNAASWDKCKNCTYPRFLVLLHSYIVENWQKQSLKFLEGNPSGSIADQVTNVTKMLFGES